MDANEGLTKLRRLGYDMDASQYIWDRRYLPPTPAEWRRRVEALIAELRRGNPCGGALHVSAGDMEYYCVEGIVIKAAVADDAPIVSEWDNVWEVDTDSAVDAAMADGADGAAPVAADPDKVVDAAMAALHDGSAAFLRAVSRPEVASALAEHEPIAAWDCSYRPDDENDPINPYLGWGGYNVSPEARLWFGLGVEPEGGSDWFWVAPLTIHAAPKMSDWHGGHWQTSSHSLGGLNDDLMLRGFNPLIVFADLLEIGLADPKSANFWHPHIYALA